MVALSEERRRFFLAFFREMDSSGISSQAPEHMIALSTNPNTPAELQEPEDTTTIATN